MNMTASWEAIPEDEVYSGSQNAILGAMRALRFALEPKGIRLGCLRTACGENESLSVDRVAGTIIHAATSPDWKTNAAGWLVSGNDRAIMVEREEFVAGPFKVMHDRFQYVIQ